MKIDVFWVVAPCSLAEIYRRFRGACLRHRGGTRGNRLEACEPIRQGRTSVEPVEMRERT
jgi:hypothetical protein